MRGICKEPPGIRLAEITARLTAEFKKIRGENTQLIKHYNEGDKLEPGVNFFSLASVTPFHNIIQLEDRDTPYLQNFHLNCFKQESPIKIPGSNQFGKKKVFYYTNPSFPYLVSTSTVCKTTEVILGPLEAAAEQLEAKNASIQEQVDMQPPNIKTLQIVLSGILTPQVQAGPIEIANTFLANTSEYDPAQIQRLKDNFIILLELCERCIFINRNLFPHYSAPQYNTLVQQQEHFKSGLQTIKDRLVELGVDIEKKPSRREGLTSTWGGDSSEDVESSIEQSDA
eukprot:CAMPEP_0168523688 /NCGR_PEP_ID=MMETSP0405-20121227/10147_1 /TAXON_ID=498012 /ORGANISM="Trichosphaerium sp, Strain Am-I-7 wt" /LENGTH=283 /DNA_ID=CAMNT_0008545639 /DNA_START=452 /DNA_END=1303 /DNA_ORIENTATION=+